MSNLLVLLICFGAGVMLRKCDRVPDNAHQAVNAFIIHVALPAVTLVQLHQVRLDTDLAISVAMPYLLFGLAALLFVALGRLFALSKATVGGLLLTAGLGNTSFVGLPMIEAFFGAEHMAVGIFRSNQLALACGLAFKLLVGPLIVLGAYYLWYGTHETAVRVEAAMPPMIGGAIVAGQYGLNPPLLTLMVGIGIPLSFITLPLWWLGLNSL